MLDLSAFHRCYLVEGGLCAGDSGFPALSIEALWTCDRVTGTTSLGHVQQSIITVIFSSFGITRIQFSCSGIPALCSSQAFLCVGTSGSDMVRAAFLVHVDAPFREGCW